MDATIILEIAAVQIMQMAMAFSRGTGKIQAQIFLAGTPELEVQQAVMVL